MNTTLPAAPSTVVSFRDARWKTKWLFVAIAVLGLWRCIEFIDRDWLLQFPMWLLLVITGVAPHVFILIYPLLTREPNQLATFGLPSPKRCLLEFGIAIPLVIGASFALAAVNELVQRISPGTSFTPEGITQLARSANHMFVYGFLLYSIIGAPITEELFFRGFLYNAFRARMPTIAALLLQSLIFGLIHFFGPIHAVYAFLVGALLTAIYEWRKTLIAPIFVHAGLNFVSAIGTIMMMNVYANSPMMGVIGGPGDTECVVRQVVPNSPAENAGIQVDDIIASFNTEPIRDFPHLRDTIALYKAGETVPVTIERSGTKLEIAVTLQRRGDLPLQPE